MASSGSSRAGSPIVAVTASFAVSASLHAGGQVLWDNGETDGIAAYSNGVEEVIGGARRTLLDDFIVPDDEVWRISGLRHWHIWLTLPPGSGTGMEILLRHDNDGEPGKIDCTLNVTAYSEVGTGNVLFNREEAESWTEFDPVEVAPGTYWFEATIIGPELNFWLAKRKVLSNECWVNYDDLGGLLSGSDVFGKPRDLAWALSGEIVAPCPADLDDSGVVDFADLLALLSAWGPCPHQSGCPEDLDDDGDVGFSDLLIVLAAWGPCE